MYESYVWEIENWKGGVSGKLGVHVGMDCTDMNMIGMGDMYYVRLVCRE